jgi:raffinose/stachyose/melibiose transport system permease protein
VATNTLLIIYVIIIVLPMVWVVLSSLKTNNEFFTVPLGLPKTPLLQNYLTAWQTGLSQYFLNSVIVTVVSVVLTVSMAAACAYGLSRFRFKGEKVALYAVLAALLLSPQVALLPLYRLLNNMNLYNTYWAIILPYAGFRLPFVIFLMRAYFLDFPRELEMSAQIDGCNTFTSFLLIVLPISKPIIATGAIVSTRFFWNEFLFALVFIDDKEKMTIPVGLTNFQSALETDYSSLMAGIVMAAIPMIVVYLALQRQFIRGLASGSVKG